MIITNDELTEILQKHSDWLNGIEGGVQADLSYVDLSGADLYRADLRGVDLSGADLSDTDLRNANLRGMNLEHANLKNANLRGADLRFSSLHGADLSGANLYHSGLEDVQGIIQWQSPIGIKRICYSVKHDSCVMHKIGCFWGDTNEAVTAIRQKYGNDSMYEQLLLLNTKVLEK
jgi:hypothetical protein